jgi:hypothetical protein
MEGSLAQDEASLLLKIFCANIKHDNYSQFKTMFIKKESFDALGGKLNVIIKLVKIIRKVRLLSKTFFNLENLFTKYHICSMIH